MSDQERSSTSHAQVLSASDAVAKRPYLRPAFRHEQVFETMALACGKISPTQGQCRFNRRNS